MNKIRMDENQEGEYDVVSHQGGDLPQALRNQTLKGKYLIGEKLNEGSYGSIFDVRDIAEGGQASGKYVLKISQDSGDMAQEIRILKKIQHVHKAGATPYPNSKIPYLLDYGVLILKNVSTAESTPCFYYIMPKYSMSLEEILNTYRRVLTPDVILEIMIQLIEALELVHSAGYTHNDLKPSNFMVDHVSNLIAGEGFKISLIDFGFARKFKHTTTGQHLPQRDLDTFNGNIIYSSLDQMNFLSTSRKDDMVSLTYNMFYLLNKLELPLNSTFDCNVTSDQVITQFKEVHRYKKKISLVTMARNLTKMKLNEAQGQNEEK